MSNLKKLSAFITVFVLSFFIFGISQASAAVISDFQDGLEDWKLTGDSEGKGVETEYEDSDKTPNKFAFGDDQTTGGVWYWKAPKKFTGDLSGVLDEYVTFDMKVSDKSSQFMAKDIIIRGADDTLIFRHHRGENHIEKYPKANWTRYEIQISPSKKWALKSKGSPATRQEMRKVLSNAKGLLIRGEYKKGSDFGYLDNVVLGGVGDKPKPNSYPDSSNPEVEVIDISPQEAYKQFDKNNLDSINTDSLEDINLNETSEMYCVVGSEGSKREFDSRSAAEEQKSLIKGKYQREAKIVESSCENAEDVNFDNKSSEFEFVDEIDLDTNNEEGDSGENSSCSETQPVCSENNYTFDSECAAQRENVNYTIGACESDISSGESKDKGGKEAKLPELVTKGVENISLVEGGDSSEIKIKLSSKPKPESSFRYSYVSLNRATKVELDISKTQLMFGANDWNEFKTIEISAIEDGEDEGTETITRKIKFNAKYYGRSNIDNSEAIPSNTTREKAVNIKIKDNDKNENKSQESDSNNERSRSDYTKDFSDKTIPNLIIKETNGSTVLKEGVNKVQDKIKVKLSKPPLSMNSTIALELKENNREIDVQGSLPATMVRDSNNWNSYQSFNLSAIDDSELEGTETVTRKLIMYNYFAPDEAAPTKTKRVKNIDIKIKDNNSIDPEIKKIQNRIENFKSEADSANSDIREVILNSKIDELRSKLEDLKDRSSSSEEQSEPSKMKPNKPEDKNKSSEVSDSSEESASNQARDEQNKTERSNSESEGTNKNYVLEPGKFYSSSDSNTVFKVRVDKNSSRLEKMPVQNSEIYFSYHKENNFEDVIEVSPKKMDKISTFEGGFLPWGPYADFKNGSIVKTVDDSRVFFKMGNELYYFENQDDFCNFFGECKWGSVRDVSRAFVENHEISKKLPLDQEEKSYPNGMLIQQVSENGELGSTVYKLQEAGLGRVEKCSVESMKALELLDFYEPSIAQTERDYPECSNPITVDKISEVE
jgi:hypothetical protein